MSDQIEDRLREAYAADDASYDAGPAVERLKGRSYHGRSRGGLWSAIGACGATVTAGIVAAILLLSQGASVAYAGWSASPATASSTLLRPVMANCGRGAYSIKTFRAAARHPSVGKIHDFHEGSLKLDVKLSEVRGKYVGLVSLADGLVFVCIDGTRARAGYSEFPGGIPAPAQTGRLSAGYVSPDIGSGAVNGRTIRGLGAGTHAYGRVGSGVSGISFMFTNGQAVQASIQNGWYFAWWPWGDAPESVQVTTASGASTSDATCMPSDSGCAFSSVATALPPP